MKIGILGGGQLAKMLALAAYPLGIDVICFSEQKDCPAANVAPIVCGQYQETPMLNEFMQGLDVLTYESENIPWDLVAKATITCPVYPGVMALEVAQDRAKEKQLFKSLQLATPSFRVIDSFAALQQAILQIGLPAVLKTTRFGYDGKGQAVLRKADDIKTAWQQLGSSPLILEEFIVFDKEVSLISVRGSDGDIKHYPLTDNKHSEGILRFCEAPFVHEQLQQEAERIAEKLLMQFSYVGVFCIEFFVRDNKLLINEIAPRVHNSGHWTIEGATTSQFENHCRAICQLPLGATEAIGFSAMFNCIGQEPALAEVLAIAQAHYHHYGKKARPKRKLAHATIHVVEKNQYLSAMQLLKKIIPFE